MNRIAIHQPNYMPWCGYFAKMKSCDVFVFLDDAEISPGQSYVHRVLIRSNAGAGWLSIPTHRKMQQRIAEVQFADKRCFRKHLNTFTANYGRCPHFDEIYELLEPVYENPGDYLAEFNINLIRLIAGYLDIHCAFERSTLLQPNGHGDERLIELTKKLSGDTYISGKGGQNYQCKGKFDAAEIALEVHTYQPVVYSHPNGQFIAGLSVVDALFNLGKQTRDILDYPLSTDSNRVHNET